MARYIDADAVIAAVRGRISMPVDNLIVEMIRDIPTISPDDVRGVGKWIDDSVASNVFRCSICENDAPVSPTDGTEYKSNYCPSCGAKMEVSEDTRKN